VKTAVAVPDDTFDRVTKRAAELGMSRSEFFTRARPRPRSPTARASASTARWVGSTSLGGNLPVRCESHAAATDWTAAAASGQVIESAASSAVAAPGQHRLQRLRHASLEVVGGLHAA
jgi:hypothetical protein